MQDAYQGYGQPIYLYPENVMSRQTQINYGQNLMMHQYQEPINQTDFNTESTIYENK